MITITIPENELFDEEKEEFINIKETTLVLEHSLVSISKWESKWHKPFISKTKKTAEEIIDYIRCMTITQNVDPNVYLGITDSIVKEILDYMGDSQTATWFNNQKKTGSSRTVTSELVYYWMTALNIPFECQKWHFNRLMTLIKVANLENQPKKKRSARSILERNAKLNAERRKRFNTRG